MRRYGLALAALLVGCFAGVAVREVVFPARAASGPSYGYRIVTTDDLIKSVKSKNPQFKNAEAREALEEGMRGFGSAGWRYAGCLPSYAIGGGVNACDHLIFEAANGDATAPPARASTAEPTHP